jgi:hypothetical protein
MDDTTSTPHRPTAIQLPNRIKDCSWHMLISSICHFCGSIGRIVGAFPRRGYG